MKYGVAVTIIQKAYVEVSASCEWEAKNIAEQMARDGELLVHDIDAADCEVERYFYEEGEEE